jgi:hypothetical protein
MGIAADGEFASAFRAVVILLQSFNSVLWQGLPRDAELVVPTRDPSPSLRIWAAGSDDHPIMPKPGMMGP